MLKQHCLSNLSVTGHSFNKGIKAYPMALVTENISLCYIHIARCHYKTGVNFLFFFCTSLIECTVMKEHMLDIKMKGHKVEAKCQQRKRNH